jgi:hypothetical protein
MMQLVGHPASPFVRKVRVMLIETGQADEVELVETVTSAVDPSPEVTAANPLKKIPALIRPEAVTLNRFLQLDFVFIFGISVSCRSDRLTRDSVCHFDRPRWIERAV